MNTLLLLLTLTGAAPALDPAPAGEEAADLGLGEPPLGDVPDADERSRRTMALSSQLRCPVCQGLSVAASPSEGARAMRDRIEGLVGQGYTDEQIVDYFVDRYGTWILLEPPKQGLKWLLWAAPAGVLVIGLGAVLARRRAAPAPTAPATPAAPAAPATDDPYRAAALAEIDGPETR